jgi:stage III sporulation protein AC
MDIEFIFKIAAIGIIVAVLNMVLIRSGNADYIGRCNSSFNDDYSANK